jgi:hypothetical protein
MIYIGVNLLGIQAVEHQRDGKKEDQNESHNDCLVSENDNFAKIENIAITQTFARFFIPCGDQYI